MRGEREQQQVMMFVICPEDMIPTDHPIRTIKKLADIELKRLSPAFDRMYSKEGRPSIPPERLLKSALLMALFSVRSERQICEQLIYNFMFRWFLDMTVNEAVFNDSVFAKNKERLLKADVAKTFFNGIVQQAREGGLLSQDHFTVDGTLIDAWASQKSFQKKDKPDDDLPPGDASRNEDVDFKGEKRSNQTHESKTDPEAKLARKGFGKEAKMSFSAHVLMENRNGLCVDISVAEANGTAECVEALKLVRREKERGGRVKTLGADKGYDNQKFVPALKDENIIPHVAAKKYTAMDARTLRSKGYQISQRCRKKVEEIFGWMKTVGGFRKTRYKGVARTGLCAYMVGAAYNLVRMSKLMAG
jgi:transposase